MSETLPPIEPLPGCMMPDGAEPCQAYRRMGERAGAAMIDVAILEQVVLEMAKADDNGKAAARAIIQAKRAEARVRELEAALRAIRATEGDGEMPRPPLSWESVARHVWDIARAALDGGRHG